MNEPKPATPLAIEVAKMMSGEWYQAAPNAALVPELNGCHDRCEAYNRIPPGDEAARREALLGLLGAMGERCTINQPFRCDYGFNVRVGEDFFANFGLTILDEAEVSFGDHVFIGPDCGFYTPLHPLDAERRNTGIERSLPIRVGSDVWFGGHVTVLPGVTIGDGAVVGAGSVVTRDVPPRTLVAGNPARVIRQL